MKENNKVYVHSGSKTFYKYIFHKISNREHWVKPMGGLWGSPLNSAYGWKQWCEDNNFNHTNSSYWDNFETNKTKVFP